jgi:hypothetical protein
MYLKNLKRYYTVTFQGFWKTQAKLKLYYNRIGLDLRDSDWGSHSRASTK